MIISSLCCEWLFPCWYWFIISINDVKVMRKWVKRKNKQKKRQNKSSVFFPVEIIWPHTAVSLKSTSSAPPQVTFPPSLWNRSRDKGPKNLLHWERTSCGRANQTRSSEKGSGAGLPRRIFYDTFLLHYAEGKANHIFLHARPRHHDTCFLCHMHVREEEQ